jgi:glycosyltransferase involved in cell wall biosynthesis
MLRHLASLRGALLFVAIAAGLGAVLTDGTASVILYTIAALAAGALIAIISLRQSEIEFAPVAAPQPTTSPPRVYVGPNDEARRAERLDRARAQILEARSAIVVGDARPPDSDATADAPSTQVWENAAVTVVVPVSNGATALARTLESIRQQSFPDWECLIVDDASLDDSVAETWRFVAIDDRFRLVRHKIKSGLAAARNTGLRAAVGRYLTFATPGEELAPGNLLERVENLSTAHERWIGGSYAASRPTTEAAAAMGGGEPGLIDFPTSGPELPFNLSGLLAKVRTLRVVGGFDESLPTGADALDLWLRLLRQGYGFRTVPVTLDSAPVTTARADSGEEAYLHGVAAVLSSYDDPWKVFPKHSPFPFTEPQHRYVRTLALAHEAALAGAVALVRGETDTAGRLMATVDRADWRWLSRHIDLDATLTQAACSVLGLTEVDLTDLEPELAPLGTALGRLAATDSTGDANEAVGGETPAPIDVLFVPENAAQARAMAETASQLPQGTSSAFIDASRVSGNEATQGTLRSVQRDSDTVDQWSLAGNAHRSMVIGFPRDGAIEELAASTAAAGGTVIELAMRGDEIMRVPESPRYPTPIRRMTSTELCEWATPDAFPDRPSTRLADPDRLGPMLWTGLTEPDPDDAFRVEEYPATRFNGKGIERFKSRHRGERCVIIGNGPSLNDLDLTLLKDVPTIGVNGIFYASDQMGFDLTYYVVEDTAVVDDNLERIKTYQAGHKFFPTIYRDRIGEASNVSYFMMNRGYYERRSPAFCVPRFSTDAAQRMYSGQSVTMINLQLAYYMGFDEVVLIGMDFSYTIPTDAKIEGDNITSSSDDPNHFHPEYFGKGKVWKNPKLDRVLANYQLAKTMFEADGRRIVNATAGGKLEIFERVDYNAALGG